MAGVTVSDGLQAVATSADGAFELYTQPAAQPFVFLVTPPGFRPRNQFFFRTGAVAGEARVEFTLDEDARRSVDTLRIAHVTDSHIGVSQYPHYASPDDLAEDFQAVAEDARPDFFIATGDLTDQGRREDLEAYHKATLKAPPPVFSLWAAHDGLSVRGLTDRSPTGYYEEVMGPAFYAFHWGDYFFLIYPETHRWSRERQQLMQGFVREMLSALAPEQKVVLATHDPTCFKPEGKPAANRSGPSVPDFALHPGLRLILNGQYHSTRILRHRGVLQVGAPPLTMGGIDTSPRGYALVHLTKNGVDVEMRSLVNRRSDSKTSSRAPRSGLRLIWERKLHSGVHRTPALALGDQAFVCAGDWGRPHRPGVEALDLKSGASQWFFETESSVKNGVVASERHAFAVSVAGMVYCFDPRSGSRIWQAALPNFPDRWIYTRPFLTSQSLCVAQYSGSAAFDPATGGMMWAEGGQWEDGWSPTYQAPPANSDAYFLITTKSLGLYAVAAHSIRTGETLWMRRLDIGNDGKSGRRLYQNNFTSLMLAGDMLLAPGLGHDVFALSAVSGDIVWKEPVFLESGHRTGVQPGSYISVFERQWLGGKQRSGLRGRVARRLLLFRYVDRQACMALRDSQGSAR